MPNVRKSGAVIVSSKKETRACRGDLETVNVSELKKMVHKLRADPELERILARRPLLSTGKKDTAAARRFELCRALHRKQSKMTRSHVVKALGVTAAVLLVGGGSVVAAKASKLK